MSRRTSYMIVSPTPDPELKVTMSQSGIKGDSRKQLKWCRKHIERARERDPAAYIVRKTTITEVVQ